MLTEKYRPTSLKEIIGQEDTIRELRGYVRMGEMPHLIFHGRPGVGKTAAAIAFSKDMDVYPDAFLELNASDDRGINVVRETIKNFARVRSIVPKKFKIVLLDEADELTTSAQQALRRTMERFHKTCRFILTANVLSNISEALQSRCRIYYFRPVDVVQLWEMVQKVEKGEGVEEKFSKEVNKAILDVSEGDARKAINYIEGLMHLKTIEVKDVYGISGMIDESAKWKLINLALAGRMEALDMVSDLMKAGVSPTGIMRAMYFTAMKPGRMKEVDRLRIIKAMGIIPGQSDEFKLSGVIAELLFDGRDGD